MVRQGERCFQHKGFPEAPPQQRRSTSRRNSSNLRTSRPRRMTRPARKQTAWRQAERSRIREANRELERARQRSDRVKKAADYCADVLTDSWQNAVADRATEYIDAELWDRLFRSRRKKHCHTLAQMALAILAGRDLIHALLGTAGGFVARAFGANRLRERADSENSAANRRQDDRSGPRHSTNRHLAMPCQRLGPDHVPVLHRSCPYRNERTHQANVG